MQMEKDCAIGILPGGKKTLPLGSIVYRNVQVDRTCAPQQALEATGRMLCVNQDVLATMPQGEGDVVDVYFLPFGHYVPRGKVSALLAEYGLVLDPRALVAVASKANPSDADAICGGSQWSDNCCLVIEMWRGERIVFCGHDGGVGWDVVGRLSGVPALRK